MRQKTRKEKALAFFETPASSRARRLFFELVSRKRKKKIVAYF